jgi:hypothetical protein
MHNIAAISTKRGFSWNESNELKGSDLNGEKDELN